MTTSGIHYCDNGCKRSTDTGRIRVITDNPSRICRKCEDNLHDWLTEIPDLYATAPIFITPGTVERNPESQVTKRAEIAAPIRLDVLDMLDTRLGRIWNGLATAHDRRGLTGLLTVQAERVITERRLSASLGNPPAMSRICGLLDRHRLWIAEQDWVKLCYEDVRIAHRQLSDANGEYRRPPVGTCPIDDPDEEDGLCGGPLFANKTGGGVHCARCHATWDADRLRQLGLILGAQETA